MSSKPAAVARRYECLDAGCGEVIVAADEAALIEAVQAHMSEVHDGFELEDVIVDSSTEITQEGR